MISNQHLNANPVTVCVVNSQESPRTVPTTPQETNVVEYSGENTQDEPKMV